MLLSLKKGIIYGPVNSRRLGRSLGINILPGGRKACPFNCVYCQYGWTMAPAVKLTRRDKVPGPEEVGRALSEALTDADTMPAYLTFSGNGEPTLHPEIDAIIDEVINARARLAPEAKTAILSNSALLGNTKLRHSLSKLDLRIMKLDCGLSRTFEEFNRPIKGLNLEKITSGLAELSRIKPTIIQTLAAAGPHGNLSPENINAWMVRLKTIKPVSVQLYTLDRDSPDRKIWKASPEALLLLKSCLEGEGLRAQIYIRGS
jgi:wyosine [tRNA(Phe)-imidazoG37] synthetase (radical SAM superfamily)